MTGKPDGVEHAALLQPCAERHRVGFRSDHGGHDLRDRRAVIDAKALAASDGKIDAKFDDVKSGALPVLAPLSRMCELLGEFLKDAPKPRAPAVPPV